MTEQASWDWIARLEVTTEWGFGPDLLWTVRLSGRPIPDGALARLDELCPGTIRVVQPVT